MPHLKSHTRYWQVSSCYCPHHLTLGHISLSTSLLIYPSPREIFYNTVIMIIVDRFSKSLQLIPLSELPIVLRTAKLIFEHGFRYFGIPMDIMSDTGLQLRIWTLQNPLQDQQCGLSMRSFLPQPYPFHFSCFLAQARCLRSPVQPCSL